MPLSESSKTFLFFLNLPELNNLITLHMNICIVDKRQSEFHHKVLTCRKLIFDETDILATPVHNGLSHIKAIVQKTKYKNQEFLESLEKRDLKIVGVEEISASSLQECIQYTSTAKMAPSWNILQNILVGSPDFLSTFSPLNAMKMDLFVASGEISICLEPMCIKLSPVNVENYVDPEKLANAKLIPLDESCHVLPSLKRGKLVSISRNICNASTFKNYSDMRKHWKDMYGYVLPNVPEHYVWYFNVQFNVPFSPLYSYPEFCVKPYGMRVIPRVDPRPILSSFIKDFCKKVGNICGEKCKIVEGRASFTSLEIFPSLSITEGMKPRAGTTYVMKSNVPYRKELIGYSSSCKPIINERISLNKENVSSNIGFKSDTIDVKDMQSKYDTIDVKDMQSKYDTQSSVKENSSHTDDTLKSISTSSQSSSTGISSQAMDSSCSQVNVEQTQVKYAPRFHPIPPKTLKSMKQSQETSKPKPYAPVFQQKQRPVISGKSTNTPKSKITPTSTQFDHKFEGAQNGSKKNNQIQGKTQLESKNAFSQFKIKKNVVAENLSSAVKTESTQKRKSEKMTSSKEKSKSVNKKIKKDSKV